MDSSTGIVKTAAKTGRYTVTFLRKYKNVRVCSMELIGPADAALTSTDGNDLFVRNLTEKMLTYALGRGLERQDRPEVDRITARLAADGYRFSTLVMEIVNSRPFEGRKQEGGNRASR